jgi:signal transduction histidine kinase/AraC-like DNA-binding protein
LKKAVFIFKAMTHILVVDDEADLERLIINRFRRKIEQQFYSFQFATNGQEALVVLQREPTIDLVLLAMNTPEPDGLTMISKLQGINPLLQVILISAYSDLKTIRSAMNLGAFDFVCKPIDFDDLELTIDRTAEHIRQLHASHQLKVIDELKNRFFDNITHEFRTPLTLILAPVSQLQQRYKELPDLYQGLQLVERNARQLLHLINQLLELAKLESGHLTVLPVMGDPGDFIGQVVRGFEPLAQEKNLRLIYRNDGTTPVAFDADKLELIVHNLIVNAIKFTPSGSVTVTLTSDSLLRLTVTDTGVGIVPEKIPFIFNRFYQVQPDGFIRALVPYINPGTGIGLALVKELTELMGGTVTVTSTSVRDGGPSGTTFIVELPLLPADNADTTVVAARPSLPVLTEKGLLRGAVPSATSAEDETDRPLILVVEDNVDLCTFIASELSGPYRLLTAHDGIEGWQIAQAELPDVVLTDVMMPGMDGYELTHRIKTEPATNHIAVIMLTAKTAQPSRMVGLQQGADDYMAKPFQFDELQIRLTNLITRQQSLRAHYQLQFSQRKLPGEPATLTDKFIEQLHTLLEAHLDDTEFRVDELAHAIGMSRRTLHRKMASVANVTVNDFIRQHRLTRGAQLLRDGHNVSEAAYAVGFESPSYFSTVFKDFFGKTPSQYLDR